LDRAIATSLAVLRRRARQTLLEYSRSELPKLLSELELLGEVGILGGLLRDSAIAYPSTFRSDVDIVVDTKEEDRFDDFFKGRAAKLNRFGGYRLRLSRGVVDAWPLQRTWAFKAGVRQGSTIRDLLGTTYFSWDSIVYSWTEQRLYCRESYLEDIRQRVLELELAENPHPLGALVRTLRWVESGRAGIGPKLVKNTVRLLGQYSDEEVLLAERQGYGVFYLREDRIRQIRLQLNRLAEESSENACFGVPASRQLLLPLAWREIAPVP
jgi:predicted nucleotidyltransferase